MLAALTTMKGELRECVEKLHNALKDKKKPVRLNVNMAADNFRDVLSEAQKIHDAQQQNPAQQQSQGTKRRADGSLVSQTLRGQSKPQDADLQEKQRALKKQSAEKKRKRQQPWYVRPGCDHPVACPWCDQCGDWCDQCSHLCGQCSDRQGRESDQCSHWCEQCSRWGRGNRLQHLCDQCQQFWDQFDNCPCGHIDVTPGSWRKEK